MHSDIFTRQIMFIHSVEEAKNTSAKKYDFDYLSLCIQSGMIIIYFRFFCV